LLAVVEDIEVEKKVELESPAELEAFEHKVQSAGGVLAKSLAFTDCYYDSEDLILTRTDHFLRDRDGVWELKVPRPQNGAAGSVYEEIVGKELIAQFFHGRYSHGNVVLPFEEDADVLEFGDAESGDGPASPADVAPPSPPFELTPFVSFTTKRRKWKLEWQGDHFSIDVDEASFGCIVAEFELMVKGYGGEAAVVNALAKIERACDQLGVVGAPNQDAASKFVKCITLDEGLLQRTRTHAPAVLGP